MSRKSRNIVLCVMCFVLLFSALACVSGDGDLVKGMLDTNQGLQDASDAAYDSGLLDSSAPGVIGDN